MALSDDRMDRGGQVSNTPRGKRYPPKHLEKQFSSPLIQIREAAMLTGLSRSEFKKRMLDGIYPSVLDEASGWRWIPKLDLLQIIAESGSPAQNGSNGFVNHSLRESKTLSQEKAAGKKPAHSSPRQLPGRPKSGLLYTGETARVVFAMLRDGKSAADVVIEQGIHPEVVRATSIAYAEINGSLVLSADEKRAIEELMMQTAGQIKTGAELIALIRENASARVTCTQCFKSGACYCEDCVTKTLHEVAARTAPADPPSAPAETKATDT